MNPSTAPEGQPHEQQGHQPQPQPAPTQHHYQPQSPKRGEFLSLRLIAAVGITVVLASLISAAAGNFIGVLTTSGNFIDVFIGGFLQGFNLQGATAMLALAVLPWLLFRSVKRSLSAEPNFTKRTVYKVTMYGGLALLTVMTASYLLSALTVIVTSLVSIGVEGMNIGNLYLKTFLPSVIGVGIAGFFAYCMLQTARGKDMTKIMTMVQAGLAVAFGLALIIATAVAMHNPKPITGNPFMPSLAPPAESELERDSDSSRSGLDSLDSEEDYSF